MKKALSISLLAFVVGFAGTAQAGKSPLMPANANFRGLSFDEWNVLAVEIDVATAWGGQERPDTIRRTRLLRTEILRDYAEFDVQIRPGTAVVLPAWAVWGELYEDGYVDDADALHPFDPDKTLLDFFYETAFVEVKLDGEVVLSGSGDELVEYQFGLTDFKDIVFYDDDVLPQPRDTPEGPKNAIAGLFTFGIGAVFHPLPPGQHTIETSVDSLVFGSYVFVYNVAVGR
jgi:hypothetical protein